jgi:hypothetical protein
MDTFLFSSARTYEGGAAEHHEKREHVEVKTTGQRAEGDGLMAFPSFSQV